MEALHPLKNLLQNQLASDTLVVNHTPYALSYLTLDCFTPSPHLVKWTTRLNSLLHSKDAGARWTGLCLCLRTSELSKSVMVEFAQSWLNVALPMLSRSEPLPIMKAAIRLILYIFSSATDVAEFQRQICTPNVLKFTNALLTLIQKQPLPKFQILVMGTIRDLVVLYPTLHRPSSAALTSTALNFLNGSFPTPTSDSLLCSASQLYSVLHLTGGKISSGNLWRKSMDDTIALAWTAFAEIRPTSSTEGPRIVQNTQDQDAVNRIPLFFDRLRCCATVICDLLRTTVQRPVVVPIGPLCDLTTAMLSCVSEDKTEKHFDPVAESMKISILPEVWRLGCEILDICCECLGRRLTSRLPQIVSIIAFQLEQNPSSLHTLFFLRSCNMILSACHPVLPQTLATRLVKATLPSITAVLRPQKMEAGVSNMGKRARHKKRLRAFDNDEISNSAKSILISSTHGQEAVIQTLSILRYVLRCGNLPPAMQSLVIRVLLSMLLSLQQTPPSTLTSDPSFAGKLLKEVQDIAVDVGLGTTSTLSSILGLLINSTAQSDAFEILLHPRLPPLLRAIPHVDVLSILPIDGEADTQTQDEPPSAEVLLADVADHLAPGIQTILHIQDRHETEVSDPPTHNRSNPQTSFRPESHTAMYLDSRATFVELRASTEVITTSSAAPVATNSMATAFSAETSFSKQRLDDHGDEDEDLPMIDAGSDSE